MRTCSFGLGCFQQKPAAASETVQSVCAFTSIGNYLSLTVPCHQHVFLRTMTVPCVLRIRAFRNQGGELRSGFGHLCVFNTHPFLVYMEFGLCLDYYCKFVLSLPNMWINSLSQPSVLELSPEQNTSALVGTLVVGIAGLSPWAGLAPKM